MTHCPQSEMNIIGVSLNEALLWRSLACRNTPRKREETGCEVGFMKGPPVNQFQIKGHSGILLFRRFVVYLLIQTVAVVTCPFIQHGTPSSTSGCPPSVAHVIELSGAGTIHQVAKMVQMVYPSVSDFQYCMLLAVL